ncbi:hypothetical protein HDU98_010383 [Podochytrium sp. JEL0797]|nr:hypothetical protein HDU98_010383 [Podochytrium sp. JEL0797]
MICGVFGLVGAIVIGALLFVYIPRQPQYSIYSIYLSDLEASSSPFSFTFDNASDTSLNELRFRMNLSFSLGAYNPNPYELNINKLSLMGQLIVDTSVVNNSTQTTPLASFASLVQLVGPTSHTPNYYGQNATLIGKSTATNLVFPGFSTSNYTVYFLFEYTPDPAIGLLQDPIVNEIASACGITDRQNQTRKMTIQYTAASSFQGLPSFTPSWTDNLYLACPFSYAQMQQVYNRVEVDKQTPFAALQAVFMDLASGLPVTMPSLGNLGGSLGGTAEKGNIPSPQSSSSSSSTIEPFVVPATSSATITPGVTSSTSSSSTNVSTSLDTSSASLNTTSPSLTSSTTLLPNSTTGSQLAFDQCQLVFYNEQLAFDNAQFAFDNGQFGFDGKIDFPLSGIYIHHQPSNSSNLTHSSNLSNSATDYNRVFTHPCKFNIKTNDLTINTDSVQHNKSCDQQANTSLCFFVC